MQHQRNDETRQRNIATLKAEKEDLEATLLTVQTENSGLRQRLSEAQATHDELIKVKENQFSFSYYALICMSILVDDDATWWCFPDVQFKRKHSVFIEWICASSSGIAICTWTACY